MRELHISDMTNEELRAYEKRENFKLNLGTFLIGFIFFWVPMGVLCAMTIHRLVNLSR
jgi:hypothetical protein